ncbi:hypothetical protein [Enterococcus raffinosus]|uniref:hypothetical protein n=1 Tax=Enterococcus TaxID=1350 RepID=UPI001C4474EF|nr:hypothetical protein [Enterococcus raffinosus]MDT2571299.1 hypothetical protein [Enterococcus raffinosus]QXJ60413.1 hypothetical protein J9537_06485 [Enterococcus raffinosus]
MNTGSKIMMKPDAIQSIGSYTASLWTNKKIVLLCDQKAFDAYGSEILQYLTIFGFDVHSCILNEVIYTSDTANLVYDFLTEQNMTKADGIIGLGDEALCQLSGYVASTYSGGMSIIQIPTTLIGQILISNQRQAFLPNLKAKYLQTAPTNPDGIVIHTDLGNIVAKDELKIAQNLLLQLGVPQDHACRHELRKKAQIMDYRLDYKQLLVELPIPLSNSKQLRFIMNKKNIFSQSTSNLDIENNKRKRV